MIHLFSLTLLAESSLHAWVVEFMRQFHMPYQDNYVLWKIIGLGGTLIFGSRTFVQWIYSEKHKEVKIPVVFWWLSVVGTVICLSYALRQKDSVFILMYTCNMIPYVRNLMLIRRKSLRDKAPAYAPVPATVAAAAAPGH